MQDRRFELEELLLEQFSEECYQMTEDIDGKLIEVRIVAHTGCSFPSNFWENLIAIIASFKDLTGIFIKIPDLKVDDLNCLSQLKKLRFLYLEAHITSADLNPLAKLNNLESLFLSESTIDDLSPLYNSGQLSSLGLPNANIRSIDGISVLSNLKEINLEGNFVEDISVLSLLPFLERIDFTKNNLTNFPTSKLSPSLRSIKLNDNYITELKFEGVLNGSLKEICISGNPIDSLFAPGDFPGLEILEIAHCKKLNLAGISNLSKLKHLDLEDCRLTDISFITELNELKYLNLNYNLIGNVFPLTHYDIKLEVLKLRGCGIIKPKDIVAFYQLLEPSLRELDLRENEFGGKLYRYAWSDREDCSDLYEFREQLKKNYCLGEDTLHALCFLDHWSSKEHVRLLFRRLLALQEHDYMFRQNYIRLCNHILSTHFFGENDVEIEQMKLRVKLEVKKFGDRMGRTLPHQFTKKKARKLASIFNESGSALDLFIFGQEIFRIGYSKERNAGIWVYKKLIEQGNPLQYVLYRLFNEYIKTLHNSDDSFSIQQGRDFELALKETNVGSFDIIAFQTEMAESDRVLIQMRNQRPLNIDFQIVIRVVIFLVFLIWFVKVLISL